jgi:hypothetical protein
MKYTPESQYNNSVDSLFGKFGKGLEQVDEVLEKIKLAVIDTK